MKSSFQFLLFCVFSIVIAALSVSSDSVLALARELPLQRPTGRSLLSIPPKQVVELVAAPNGTIYLINSDSRKVLWSFPSGPPIYSSYQAAVPHDSENATTIAASRYSFIDCEDDWELYLNNQHEKQKLDDTIDDYVKKTPVYDDDEVTVGSRHSSVFKVNFWSGRLINDYGRSISPFASQGVKETQSVDSRKSLGGSESSSAKGSDVELYIERIDYSLSTKAFDKLLWNLTIGFFKARLRCKGTEHFLDGTSFNLDHKLVSSSDAHKIIPLPCGFELGVRRFRRQSMFEYFIGLDTVPGQLSKHNILQANDPTGNQLHRELLERGTRSYKGSVGSLSVLRRYAPWSFVLLALLVIGYAVHRKIVAAKRNVVVNAESYASAYPASSKRKKSRKSGKSMLVQEEGLDNENSIKRWLNLNSLVEDDMDGRTVGRLFVSKREIAKGSNGTVVYEGVYEGRKVAVKRLVQAHHEVAFKEIQNLIASDQHPNIVRWDVVCGLVHLHDLGIIHRDIKPQNVLISKEKNLCAKLSDMGISKRLLPDNSSLGHRATGHGSSGWQAPELLLRGRQTRAMDMFSLGCVLFYCVTGGRHPFGDQFERDGNIIKNQMDLFLVEKFPEALELFSRLLHPEPQMRPKAMEVLHDPFFWDSEMRLSFLHDTSDRVELEDRESGSDILKALESIAPTAIGTKWDEKLELAFINNIGHYRRYRYDSIRDLLRVMRNKLNHYRELPAEIQGLLGAVPDGFDEYFRSRFPHLLIEVYKVVYKYCRAENWFQKYLQATVA